MEWVNQYINDVDSVPRPNWEAIYTHVEENYKNVDQHELWCQIARAWMQRLISSLNSEYKIHESTNFIIVTSESEQYVSAFQEFLERTL